MAKGSNMSKCPGMVSGCDRFGSVITVKRFLTNYGFRFQYDVDLTGFELSEDQLRSLSSSVSKLMKSLLNQYAAYNALSDIQPELFDGLC